ncbi:MAG: hypothetical protein ABW176_05825 [Candidatus Thiodiazotropha endolucinida]
MKLEWMKKNEPVYKKNEYLGFDMVFDIGNGKIASSFSKATLYDYCKEVCYVTNSAITSSGEDIFEKPDFPYKSIAQRIRFYDVKGKARVHHQVYIESKGVWGWLICNFWFFPHIKKEILNVSFELKDHLKECL